MTFVTLANGRRAAYTPPLFPARHRAGYPQAKFFLFYFPTQANFLFFLHHPTNFFYFSTPQSLPYPFLYRFCPFFSLLSRFLRLCVYFIVRGFFVALWAKKMLSYGHKKRADGIVCPVCPFCHFLCRNDVLFFCGSIALTFPFIFGVMRS